MKKWVVLLTSVSVAAGIFAESNTVTSANILGYMKITIPANNKYALISVQFSSESNTIASVFSDVPTGTEVLVWDKQSQQYQTFSKSAFGWSVSAQNFYIDPSIGLFVKLSANETEPFELMVSGDVLIDDAFSIFTEEGLNLISYPYPVEVLFKDIALANNANVSDEVYFWNDGWETYSKNGFTGWASVTNKIVSGQGFFFKSTKQNKDEVVINRPFDLD